MSSDRLSAKFGVSKVGAGWVYGEKACDGWNKKMGKICDFAKWHNEHSYLAFNYQPFSLLYLTLADAMVKLSRRKTPQTRIGVKAESTAESVSKLEPAFVKPRGTHNAANSSYLTDGAWHH